MKIKTAVVRIAVCILFGSLYVLEAGSVAGQTSAEKELMEIEDRYTAAYLAKDLDAFFKDTDPGMTVFHASNPYRVDNRKQIYDALKAFYKDSSPTGLYKLQPQIQIHGDTAVVTYHFVETGEAEQGKLYAYDGKQTDVFARKNGRWTLVHFHSSRVVKPN
ncbi:MAG: nuclear transport factor 2 family protein [Acidobacteria bacterium]|nr:nuclear transport factor 2 family protein [Acidobacteriota bacterium]MCW5970035.1 nuclear transport factor 2 family protein [Blastocatellales bacterium]